jgi:hypothetical protein
LIPGRPAPRLISDAQLASMRTAASLSTWRRRRAAMSKGWHRQDRRPPRRLDRRCGTIGADAGGRFLGLVRAQPLQFPERLLGQ